VVWAGHVCTGGGAVSDEGECRSSNCQVAGSPLAGVLRCVYRCVAWFGPDMCVQEVVQSVMKVCDAAASTRPAVWLFVFVWGCDLGTAAIQA
jgi:hypothetical protein